MRQLGATALFAAKFRENAARSLLLPKRRPGMRAPLWQQRKRAADLLGVASRYGSFPVLLDPRRAAADRYGVVTIPSSFVLDPDGLVVERIDGEADWTGAELLATLDALLKRRARAAAAGSDGDAS